MYPVPNLCVPKGTITKNWTKAPWTRFIFVTWLLMASYSNAHFVNHWAIDVIGDRQNADIIAKESGCENKGMYKFRFYIFVVRDFYLPHSTVINAVLLYPILFVLGAIIENTNTYLLECHLDQKRSANSHSEVHAELSSHRFVSLAEQQKVLSRKKRDLMGWEIGREKRQFGQFGGNWGGMRQPMGQHSRTKTVQTPQENYVDLMHLNDNRSAVVLFDVI